MKLVVYKLTKNARTRVEDELNNLPIRGANCEAVILVVVIGVKCVMVQNQRVLEFGTTLSCSRFSRTQLVVVVEG